MNREEAIYELNGIRQFMCEDAKNALGIYLNEKAINETLDMAIEALKEPEIVRCGECKWQGTAICPVWEGAITEDYMWCWEGERK